MFSILIILQVFLNKTGKFRIQESKLLHKFLNTFFYMLFKHFDKQILFFLDSLHRNYSVLLVLFSTTLSKIIQSD